MMPVKEVNFTFNANNTLHLLSLVLIKLAAINDSYQFNLIILYKLLIYPKSYDIWSHSHMQTIYTLVKLKILL